jgi:hypothetical protein
MSRPNMMMTCRTDDFVRPDAPELSLHLRVNSQDGVLWTTLPFGIEFTIKRAQDGHQRPCIFNWSPTVHGFSPNGFILLRHDSSSGDTKRIEVDHSGLVKLPEEDDPMVVNGWNQFLWELDPGQEVKFLATLPERYHKLAVPGESYTLLWPGGEIPRWEWGTIREHLNHEMRARAADETPTKPRLVLPGGPSVSFESQEYATPWPARAMREAKAGFHAANLEEQKWRLRQQQKERENPRPKSPAPIDTSERMYVHLHPRRERPDTDRDGWTAQRHQYYVSRWNAHLRYPKVVFSTLPSKWPMKALPMTTRRDRVL